MSGVFVVFEISRPFQTHPKAAHHGDMKRWIWLWFAVAVIPESFSVWLRHFTATARAMERERRFSDQRPDDAERLQAAQGRRPWNEMDAVKHMGTD